MKLKRVPMKSSPSSYCSVEIADNTLVVHQLSVLFVVISKSFSETQRLNFEFDFARAEV